jgi:hypothetical protein
MAILARPINDRNAHLRDYSPKSRQVFFEASATCGLVSCKRRERALHFTLL